MGTSDLPDTFAQSPRAVGIHIRQTKSAHVTARVPMLQLICNTSVQADNLDANMSVTTGFILYACLEDLIMVRQ